MPFSAGESPEAQIHRLVLAFEDRFGARPDVLVARAPGRVNLIGDHTDYSDGFVLPMTIDRDVFVVARARPDSAVRLHSLNFDDDVGYDLDHRPDSAPGNWASYVTGAVEELRLRGLVSHGFEMLVDGDVPLGAGLSSSAALEVAVVFGLQSLFEFDIDPIETAHLCQLVEHRYAGVRCGIMDQFASRLGRRGHALFLDCRSLEHEHIPLPLSRAGLALVIADSGVSRELSGSKYGERRRECEQFVEAIRRKGVDVTSLRDVTSEMLALEEGTLGRRARHVVEENARVQRARDALRAGDYDSFGRLMNDSHAGLRDLFEVSCPELDLLVEAAQGVDGVLGARMTGGGFGGCTVNLVRQDAVDDLREQLRHAFSAAFGREPHVYVLEHNHQTEVLYSVDG